MFAPAVFIKDMKFGKLVAIDETSSTTTGNSLAVPITKKDMAIR